MTVPAMTRTRRQFGRMAAVGAAALVLAGTMAAAPAEARKRSEALADARRGGRMCGQLGGTWYQYDMPGYIYAECSLPDETIWWEDHYQEYDGQ